MKIIVRAKTRAKKELVERVGQPSLDIVSAKNEMVAYKVCVKEAPISGKANEAIISALATYFDVSSARIRLITGQTSKQKIFEIL